MQRALQNPFVKGSNLIKSKPNPERKENESAESVQTNPNSVISHRNVARRARIGLARARGRCNRLERDRVELDRRDCRPAAAGLGAALCDGARGSV